MRTNTDLWKPAVKVRGPKSQREKLLKLIDYVGFLQAISTKLQSELLDLHVHTGAKDITVAQYSVSIGDIDRQIVSLHTQLTSIDMTMAALRKQISEESILPTSIKAQTRKKK